MWRLSVAFLVMTGLAHADVIFEEPTRPTCGRAEVIVTATVDGTTTTGPFTNANPATVKITATECWQGCKPGDKLEVASWVDPKPVHSGGKGGDPKVEQAAWEKAAVQPPATGTKLLLFLYRDGKRLVRVQDSGGYGGYVMLKNPNDNDIARKVGMCRFGVGFDGERDRTIAAGKPVPVHFEITNTTKRDAPFHGELLKLTLQTDTRPGEDFAPVWATRPALVTIKAGATLAFDWDLAKLFPGQFVKPGSYWVTLDGPGTLGLHALAFSVK